MIAAASEVPAVPDHRTTLFESTTRIFVAVPLATAVPDFGMLEAEPKPEAAVAKAGSLRVNATSSTSPAVRISHFPAPAPASTSAVTALHAAFWLASGMI